jgi:hypothetical protein
MVTNFDGGASRCSARSLKRHCCGAFYRSVLYRSVNLIDMTLWGRFDRKHCFSQLLYQYRHGQRHFALGVAA